MNRRIFFSSFLFFKKLCPRSKLGTQIEKKQPRSKLPFTDGGANFGDLLDGRVEIKDLAEDDFEDLLHVDRIRRGAKDEWGLITPSINK